MKRRPAFTLIELLFVIVIIAVLAAIAVPNFLDAQVRSKIARSQADMAVVAAALRAYHADYNRYPPNAREVTPFLHACLSVPDVNRASLPTPPGQPRLWTNRKPPGQTSMHRGFEYGEDDVIAEFDEPVMMPMDGFPPSEGAVDPFAPAGTGAVDPLTPPAAGATTPTLSAAGDAANSLTLADSQPADPLTDEAFPPVVAVPPGIASSPWWGSSPVVTGYPVLDDSGYALSALTTPVAYFSRALPLDPFSDLKTPFLYINYIDVFGSKNLIHDGGKERRYLLLSFGPDTDQSEPHFVNPLFGPFTPYDPTNGTVSIGEVARFGY